MTLQPGAKLGAYNKIPSELGKGGMGKVYRVRNTRLAQTVTVEELPPRSGTYALVLCCRVRRRMRVGHLGMMELQPGFYVYVGSALGPGGLRARIAHHVRGARRPRWHIDYLRAHALLDQIWYCCDLSRREHQWARALEAARDGAVPLPGFGASDCHCRSHLYFFERRPSRTSFERWLPGKMARK
jgi:Uri superfamily endonuclease